MILIIGGLRNLKKFNQKKFTPAKKETLLIELNDAKDKLNAFGIEELLKILPDSRKILNNSQENNHKEKELINNTSYIEGKSKSKSKKKLFL